MNSGIESEGAKMADRIAFLWSRERLGAFLVTLSIVAVATAFLIGSSALLGRPGQFPFAVAVITITLGAIELVRQLAAIRRSDGEALEAATAADPTMADKAVVVTWFVLTIAGVLTVGVLITSFVAGVIYYRWVDRRSTFAALVAGAMLTTCLWIVFELLAGFRLYGGMLW